MRRTLQQNAIPTKDRSPAQEADLAALLAGQIVTAAAAAAGVDRSTVPRGSSRITPSPRP